MLKFLGTTKVALFAALLMLSVSTLAQSISQEEHKLIYSVITAVSHVGLVVLGIAYTKSYINNKNKTKN